MESLSVPGSLESLKAIRDFIGKVAYAAGLSQARTYGLALAVDEVATNIVTHGYEEAGLVGDVRVLARVSKGTVEITLQDTGIAFDPLSRPAPGDLDTPLAERNMGGLGIFLAQKNVDEFRYEYVDGRNHNIFVIHAD